MAKTSLTRRMEKAKAPSTWIREVKAKGNRIERLIQLKETYLNIIDRLSREKEQLESTNAELLEALEELLSHPSDDYEDAIDTDDGYTLTPLAISERKAKEAIRKAKSHADTLKGGRDG